MKIDEIDKKDIFLDRLKHGKQYIFYAGDSTNIEALLYSGYHNAKDFAQGVERAIPVEYSTFLAGVGGLSPRLATILEADYLRDLETGTYILYDRISDVYHLFATRKDV